MGQIMITQVYKQNVKTFPLLMVNNVESSNGLKGKCLHLF